MGDDWTALEGVETGTLEGTGEDELESAQGRQVREWRLSQFAALGFTLTETLLLGLSGADLNDARKLIGAGCCPATAAEILL